MCFIIKKCYRVFFNVISCKNLLYFKCSIKFENIKALANKLD